MSRELHPKALRVVVLIDGAVVDERIVRKRVPLSLGRGARCDLLASSADAPLRCTLFGVRRGRWVLELREGMQARVSEGDGPIEKLERAGARTLAENARGKVMLGEVTVLFQLVAAPAPPAPPPFPRALRLRLRDRVDPYLAAVVVFSLFAHGGAIGWLLGRDTPRPPEPVEDYAVLEHRPLARLPLPRPLPASAAPAMLPLPATTPASPDEPTRRPAPGTPAAPVAAAPSGTPEDARALIDVLGHAGKQPGRFLDITDAKNPGGDLRAGVDRAAERGLALADTRRPDARGPGSSSPTIGDGRDPGVVGPRDVLADARPARGTEAELGPIIDLPRPAPGAGEDDPQGVYDKIRRFYFGQVQKCYEGSLKHDASLRGRVDVTLTIGGRGQVVAVSASGFDAALDQCIEAGARRWHFDAPSGGDPATYEFPFSFAPARR